MESADVKLYGKELISFLGFGLLQVVVSFGNLITSSRAGDNLLDSGLLDEKLCHCLNDLLAPYHLKLHKLINTILG